jgi:hypothetical protein
MTGVLTVFIALVVSAVVVLHPILVGVVGFDDVPLLEHPLCAPQASAANEPRLWATISVSRVITRMIGSAPAMDRVVAGESAGLTDRV